MEAPEDGRVLASCFGKAGFDTYSLAEKITERRRKRGRSNSIYRCRFCHKFHVGSSNNDIKY